MNLLISVFFMSLGTLTFSKSRQDSRSAVSGASSWDKLKHSYLKKVKGKKGEEGERGKEVGSGKEEEGAREGKGGKERKEKQRDGRYATKLGNKSSTLDVGTADTY